MLSTIFKPRSTFTTEVMADLAAGRDQAPKDRAVELWRCDRDALNHPRATVSLPEEWLDADGIGVRLVTVIGQKLHVRGRMYEAGVYAAEESGQLLAPCIEFSCDPPDYGLEHFIHAHARHQLGGRAWVKKITARLLKRTESGNDKEPIHITASYELLGEHTYNGFPVSGVEIHAQQRRLDSHEYTLWVEYAETPDGDAIPLAPVRLICRCDPVESTVQSIIGYSFED